MGSFSIWHWLIVLVIVVLLFGAGKIPKLMGDVAKGVKAFKKGLKDEVDVDDADSLASVAQPQQRLDNSTTKTVDSAPVKDVVKD